MKLLKCHIENFGKLSNFDYDFTEGLNVIKEDNGFGKTTFASFIKAMFYGMDGSRSNQKNLSDRKKYFPWQGGNFGGNIEFEVNNNKYKIERFFDKKEANDTFELYDLSTGLPSKEYSQNIGEDIFKLNKEAFERSIFIYGQNMETSMNDSINAKLGNILENENDVNTSEKAIKSLENAMKIYKKNGGKGEINEKIKEKTLLEQKLEHSKIDEKALQDRKGENEKLKIELSSKKQEQSKLQKLLAFKTQEEVRTTKLKQYEKLQDNTKKSKDELEKLKSFFKDEIPADEEIQTVIDKCLTLENYKTELKEQENSSLANNELQNLRNIFQDKDISEDSINKRISECNQITDITQRIETNKENVNKLNSEKEKIEKQKHGKKNLSIIFGVLSVISLALGILSIAFIAVFLVFLIICIIQFMSMKKINTEFLDKENEINEILEVRKELENNLEQTQKDVIDFIKLYSTNAIESEYIMALTEIKTEYAKYKTFETNLEISSNKKKDTLKKLNELEESLRNYLLKYFDKLSLQYVKDAQTLQYQKEALKRQQKDYEEKLKEEEAYKELNNIEELESKDLYTELEDIDKNINELNMLGKEEIQKKLDDLLNEINNLSDHQNYIKNQMELLESNLDATFDIESEITELEQNIEEMNQNYEILEKTQTFLEKAKEQFSSHYLDDMKKSFLENFNLINESNLDINLDVNLEIKINEQGSNKEINYLSTGYKDLIYICMRLSLINALFQDEKPFIILDDPFVNLDETKIKNAMEFLKNISDTYQIIYFICHESRKG